MDKLVDIIVSGCLCLDILPHMDKVPLDELPSPGRLFEVGPLTMETGGAVSNTGLALHRLGADVRLMASVGDDLLGEVIRSAIGQRDPVLKEDIRVVPGKSSSYTVVLSPERVDRIFLHASGTNESFSLADVDMDLVAQSRIFHLGYPTIMPNLAANDGAEMATIYRKAKEAGAVTVLDMSMPDPTGTSGRVNWAGVLRNSLPYVDIFVPSIDEIIFMLRREEYDAWGGDVHSNITADYLAALADDMLAMGAVITGFKLGAYGMYLQGSDDPARYERLARLDLNVDDWLGQRAYHPVFEVEVMGTTGAGDSAYAGLLAALLRGLPPTEAARWACAVGACNVESIGATSGIRSWEETQARMDAGWPVSARRVPGL